MASCDLCNQPFKRRKKPSRGYNKHLKSAKLRDVDATVFEALQKVYQYEGTSEGHICNECLLKTENKFRDYTSLPSAEPKKRKQLSPHKRQPSKKVHASPVTPKTPRRKHFSTSTPISSVKRSFSFSTTHHHTPPKLTPILNALRRSHYYTALRLILNHSPKVAGEAFDKVVQRRVVEQAKAFASSGQQFTFDGMRSISMFSWESFLAMAKTAMPTLSSAIHGSFGLHSIDTSGRKNRRIKSVIQPRIGMMQAIALFTLKPHKFKAVQSLSSIQLWRSGASEKLFKCFNHMGISLSASASRRLIDKLCDETDETMVACKESVEGKVIQQKSPQLGNISTIASYPDASDDSDDDFLPSMEESMEVSLNSTLNTWQLNSSMGKPLAEEEVQGFAFVWDNIQKLSITRDSSLANGNKMHMWANAFSVLNRVNPIDLETNDLTMAATDIPMSCYLQNQEDVAMLQERLEAIVGRVLVKHLKHFQDYGDVCPWHIPHEFSDKAAQASKVVNIGIIHENPSTRAGATAIMLELQKKVPRRPDGRFRVVPCHGDGLSVERMVDSKRSRGAEHTDIQRLDGLEPCPQEFHHRGLMLQDTMNMLFNGASVAERGTLAQLRNDFGHHSVTKDVMNTFNFADNFIRFTTEAHVVYLMLHLYGMSHMDEVPRGAPPENTSREGRQVFFQSVCKAIVKEVWCLTTCSDINAVLEANVAGVPSAVWCHCGEEEDHEMVRCSNQDCPCGSWFHTRCIDLNILPGPDEDWWCSEECQATGSSFSEGTTWYCSGGKEPDYVRNYAIGVTWYGLLDMAHRDVIREGDGLAMMAMWRINMTRFWAGRHYKYMILEHRLLAGINGYYPPRLSAEMVHNRTCNIEGGPGKNIANDRVNEFLNNEFKEHLKHSHGQYTDLTVRRAGKIVGPLARSIDQAFYTQVSETNALSSYRKKYNYHDDITTFIKDYMNDKLFTTTPGRKHHSFDQFQPGMAIQSPEKLRARLIKYTKKLDLSKNQYLK